MEEILQSLDSQNLVNDGIHYHPPLLNAVFFKPSTVPKVQVCPEKGINPTILFWGWD